MDCVVAFRTTVSEYEAQRQRRYAGRAIHMSSERIVYVGSARKGGELGPMALCDDGWIYTGLLLVLLANDERKT